jgi:dolichol-phosphate mannosyltransferase
VTCVPFSLPPPGIERYQGVFPEHSRFAEGRSVSDTTIPSPSASTPTPARDAAAIAVSVVVPVLNEQDNVAPLIAEIRAAFIEGSGAPGGFEPGAFKPGGFEIVYVDDGSDDGTPAALTAARESAPELRVLRHEERRGQSEALRTGILAARGLLIVTLDGDRQNDPADIPKLIAAHARLDAAGRSPIMITGHRVNRRDTGAKRRASRMANWLRARALGDDNPDTGCSLKLFERDLYLRMPYFNHMHRFLPALALREGAVVEVVPVNHRAREQGVSKYNNLARLKVGVFDLLGVMWLMRRAPKGGTVREME